jgi:archaellum biogenesis ATPase FlaH
MQTETFGSFRVSVGINEFLQRPSPDWLIDGFIPATGLTLFYGESGAGKTFFAIDMICAVANGARWRGKPTKQGSVFLIAAEDSAGTRKRLRAYCVENGIDYADLAMRIVERNINLMDQGFVDSVIEDIRSLADPKVVLIDTLATSAPGVDENTSRDMSRFLFHCKKIYEDTGVVVIVIHHCGKDHSRGARGWSGLKAAADTVINIQKRSDHMIAGVEKQKNWTSGDVFGFRLKQVHMCPENQMDASCVIEHVDSVLDPVDEDLGEVQRKIMRTLSQMVDAGNKVIENDLLARLVSSDAAPPDGVRDRRKEKYQRSIRTLLERGVFLSENGFLSIDDGSPF